MPRKSWLVPAMTSVPACGSTSILTRASQWGTIPRQAARGEDHVGDHDAHAAGHWGSTGGRIAVNYVVGTAGGLPLIPSTLLRQQEEAEAVRGELREAAQILD